MAAWTLTNTLTGAETGMNFVFLQDPMVWLELTAVLLTLGYLVRMLTVGIVPAVEPAAKSYRLALVIDDSRRRISERCRAEFERLMQFGTFVTVSKESLSGQKV